MYTEFLGDDDERRDLLRRQEDYRAFEACFLGEQAKEYTEDTLGYVSKLEVGDLRIAIIGLNSSWLSEGGESDDGNLLIGERQVDEAISLARGYAPHVVLSLQHHPFNLLQHFDRRPVQRKLESACDVASLRPPARSPGHGGRSLKDSDASRSQPVRRSSHGGF